MNKEEIKKLNDVVFTNIDFDLLNFEIDKEAMKDSHELNTVIIKKKSMSESREQFEKETGKKLIIGAEYTSDYIKWLEEQNKALKEDCEVFTLRISSYEENRVNLEEEVKELNKELKKESKMFHKQMGHET